MKGISMNYQIRQLCQDDVPAIARLYIEAYSDSIWQEKWHYEDAYQRINELRSSPVNVGLICHINGIIVGCIISEILSWHTGKQLEIKEVFVSPKYRNRGIGRSLVMKMEEIGKERNVREFFLWTNNGRQLTHFYKRIGYNTSNNVIQLIKQNKEDSQ